MSPKCRVSVTPQVKNSLSSIWSFWCQRGLGDGELKQVSLLEEPVVVATDPEPSASCTAVLLDLPDQ